MYTLRKKINEVKADFHKRGGREEYWSETLAWILQDYHGSKGSVLDFTEDDWLACRDNGITLSEVLELCNEQYLEHTNLVEYVPACLVDWRKRTGEYTAPDMNIPMQDVLAYIQDFYTWRKELLPKVEEIYGNG